MKLLIDQNLSYKLVAKIINFFPDSAHIAALNLDRASDHTIWEYAKKHNFIILTKDSDFNELSTYHGFPPHIIWLRLGNSSVEKSSHALLKYASQIKDIILNNQTGIIEIRE